MMLPIPSIDYIPKIYRDESNSVVIAFTTILDNLLEEIRTELINYTRLYDISSVDSSYLDVLGDMFNAGFIPSDTETIKRRKLRDAIETHKYASTWEFDIREKVNDIAGGNAVIIDRLTNADWVLFGGSESAAITAYYWGTMGVDGVDDELGLNLIGGYDQIEVAGNIYIDVDNNSLSADDQELIRIAVENAMPVYYRVYFGYIDTNDLFVEYFHIG